MIEGTRQKNKGGAPRGNQNARKHGFYSKVLSPQQREMLSEAVASASLDPEIAVMRVKIASILGNDPVNRQVLIRAVAALARLVRANRRLEDREDRSLRAAARVVSRLMLPDNSA